MMDADRWRQIETVFQTALKSEPDLRPLFLEQACVDDAELREEVRTLLAAHDEAGSFMDTTALAVAAALEAPDPLSLAQVQSLGPYSIITHIATGGMGDVYLAQDAKLDRKIALKVLSSDFASDHERVRRFRQEARAASALNHPNIITIYDIGEEAGFHYIAMEFVEGDTIRQRLADRGLTINEALDVIIQAAGALEAAHQAGIVHRDIKPENIMLRPDGYAKVLDFGLAKLADLRPGYTPTNATGRHEVKTEPGMVMGTARYMSPEQARGLSLDGRTDVFSLGVVLYEMIAGEPPFKGDTAIDAVAAMLNTEPPPLAARAPYAPPELEAIVSKAMRKNRQERFETMGQFLAELTRLRQQSTNTGAFSAYATTNGGEAVSAAEMREAARPTDRQRAEAGAATRPLARTAGRRLWLVAAASLLLIASLIYLSARNKMGSGTPGGATGPAVANSIVVLPFVDSTDDKSDDYLPEGIGDSLIDSLSRLSRLNVMSRQSALRYKGRTVGADVAGRELGVQTVVSGRVASEGDRVWITVEIDAAKDNRVVWSRQYSGAMADLLGLQEQISSEVSSELLPQMTEADQRALRKQFTQSSEAYIFYLKGLHSMGLRTAEGLRESIDLFKQAAVKDQQYALAFAGLADAYVFMGDYGISSPSQAMEQAQTAVAKALNLDENLAEAHTTLGHLKLYYYWDWKDAEAQFKRAIDLKPNYAAAHQGLANYYAALGRFGEAIAEINTALGYDPLSSNLNQAKGFHLYLAGHYDDAIQQLQTTLQSNPDFVPAHAVLGMAYLQKSLADRAIAEFQRCLDLSKRSPAYLGHMGRAYAEAGNSGQAREVVAEMKQLEREQFVPSLYLARVYSALNDKDAAFQQIAKAYEERDSELIIVGVDPAFEKLRSDRRFSQTLKRMGLNQ